MRVGWYKETGKRAKKAHYYQGLWYGESECRKSRCITDSHMTKVSLKTASPGTCCGLCQQVLRKRERSLMKELTEVREALGKSTRFTFIDDTGRGGK